MYRDDERRAAYLRARGEARLRQERCAHHPVTYADTWCDACRDPICGACVRLPIDGSRLCVPCLSVARRRWWRIWLR